MIIAATITFHETNAPSGFWGHSIEEVYTSLEYASIDDVLNKLRHEYLEKYDNVVINLVIETETLEYSLVLKSHIYKRHATKLREISDEEHEYLAYVLEVEAARDL
jgi:hypothetical protein